MKEINKKVIAECDVLKPALRKVFAKIYFIIYFNGCIWM